MADPVFVGEGGGGGVAFGVGDADREGGVVSRAFSAGACASNRDNEDGPAFGEEFDRDRMGKR